jgi:hypothetical protein
MNFSPYAQKETQLHALYGECGNRRVVLVSSALPCTGLHLPKVWETDTHIDYITSSGSVNDELQLFLDGSSDGLMEEVYRHYPGGTEDNYETSQSS